VLERALDPDRWALRSREMPDDGGVALQRKRSPDWEAHLMRTCSGLIWAVQAAFWGTGPTPSTSSMSTTPRQKPQISLTGADCLSLLDLLAAHTKLHKRRYSTTVKQTPVVSASTLLTLFGQPLCSGFPIDPKIAHSLRLLPAGALNAGDTEGREGNGWECGTLVLVRMDLNRRLEGVRTWRTLEDTHRGDPGGEEGAGWDAIRCR
jgi:hypothetical protein